MIFIPNHLLKAIHTSHTSSSDLENLALTKRNGKYSRVRLHSQCRSPYRHPVTNSQNFSSPQSPTSYVGEQTPLLAGVIPVFEIFISGWEKLKKKRLHLVPFIQPVGLCVQILSGPTFRRHIFSECVRPVHQLVFEFTPIMTLSVVNLPFESWNHQ